jgi:hypothetical protein
MPSMHSYSVNGRAKTIQSIAHHFAVNDFAKKPSQSARSA